MAARAPDVGAFRTHAIFVRRVRESDITLSFASLANPMHNTMAALSDLSAFDPAASSLFASPPVSAANSAAAGLAGPVLSGRYALALVLACSALLSACSKPEPAPEPVRSVKLITVGAGAIEARPEYAGEVRARVESRLGFRVAGKITERPAQLGQHVQAGQLLAQLDPRDYQLSAEAARAQVVSATTQRDLAAADVRRYQKLRAENFISGAEMERREANLKAAQATLDQAKAQLAAQTNQQTYTRLLADVAGVITAVEAEPGQVVNAGTPVVRIAQDGPRDIVFSVPEDRQALVKIGQKFKVTPWKEGLAPMDGVVREVAASADPATRTYQVKVAVQGDSVLPLGATVQAQSLEMPAMPMAVIKLPTTALRQTGQPSVNQGTASTPQGSAVWLFDPATSTVKLQPVVVATADGDQAVIAAGLQPGMQVVATGVHVLNPGQKVTVYQDKYSKDKNRPSEPVQPVQAATKSEVNAAPAVAPVPQAEPAAPAGTAGSTAPAAAGGAQ